MNPHQDYLARYWQMGFEGLALVAGSGDASLKAYHEGVLAREKVRNGNVLRGTSYVTDFGDARAAIAVALRPQVADALALLKAYALAETLPEQTGRFLAALTDLRAIAGSSRRDGIGFREPPAP